MIIKDLYETNITCSNYNPAIDSGNGSTTVTVTVNLVDFNGNPVTGKNLTLSVDKGYFKSVTGTSTTNYSNTTTKSVSATTKSDGIITAVYVPSEWGLCTFSANNSKIQVSVRGFKEITKSGEEYCRVWVDESSKTIRVTASRSITVASANAENYINFSSKVLVDDAYLPIGAVYAQTNWNGVIVGVSLESGVKGRLRVRSDRVISHPSLTEAYLEWTYI